MDRYHTPVLLQEVLEALKIRPGARYIDATVGTGGHTKAILQSGNRAPGGVGRVRVLGIDRDPEAIRIAAERLKAAVSEGSLQLVRTNFDNLENVARARGFDRVDGILFDLGMSSRQLFDSGRGFSFGKDEPLDMRMDPELSVTAADLVNALGRKELEELLTKFGQVARARSVAQAIVAARKRTPLKTTRQLVEAVGQVATRRRRIHPATKVMMALRIAVNDELNSLTRALPQAVRLLRPGGRLGVISFHEGEDRIVKQFMRGEDKLKLITKKPLRPAKEEILANPRASSAKLRVACRK